MFQTTKRTTKKIVAFLLFLIAFAFLFKFSFDTLKTEDNTVEKLREKHQSFLDNSPYKKTKVLSRKDRKGLGLPPNAYNEQMWELTLDPNTGRPMPERVLEVQEQLKKQRTVKKRGGGDSFSPWVDRGPNNVGGRTRGIMFDPNDANKNRVFAGGVSGGLWLNEDITDANSSWTLVPGIGANISVTSIIYDPNDTETFYIGSGESYTTGNAVGRGVWKSDDIGVTWTNIFGGFTSASGGQFVNGIFYINDIVARDVGTTTELYIAVAGALYAPASNPNNFNGLNEQGVYKSINNGASWTRFTAPADLKESNGSFSNPNDIEIDLDNNIWFTTTRSNFGFNGGKIFKSTDGLTFTLITTIPNAGRTELEPSSTDVNKFWVAADVGGQADLWFTDDAFATFDAVTARLPEPNDADTGISATDFTRGQAFYDLPLEVDASDNLYVGGIDLFKSLDDGATWEQISKWSNNNNLASLNVPLVHADHHAIVFRPGAPTEAVFGTDGGIYYTPDSTAEAIAVLDISSRNKDYNVTQFYYGSIASGVANEIILGGAQDNGTQISQNSVPGANDFDNYHAFVSGDGSYSEIDQDGGNIPGRVGEYMIVGNTNLQYFLSDVAYTSTNQAATNGYQIVTSGGNIGSFINQADLDDVGNILYANSTVKSASTGAVITPQFSSFTLGPASATRLDFANTLLNAEPSAFKVSPHTNTNIFVGTRNSKVLKVTGLVGAPVWADISGASFVGSISDIEIGTTDQEIFVTVHNYGITSIWYTIDGGTTWLNKEGDLPDIPVKCILQNPLEPAEVIIGTQLGVWKTVNFKAASPTWVQSYNGMSDVNVLDLDLRAADNTILGTTHGRGMFTSVFSTNNFAIAVSSSSSVTVCSPNDVTYNFTYNTTSDFSGITTFSAVGLPAGSSAVFSPVSANADGTAVTVTVSGIASVADGAYSFQIQGTSGVITKTVEVNFIISSNPPNAPTLSAPTDALTDVSLTPTISWVADSNALSYEYEVATDNGFASIVQSGNLTTASVELNLLNPTTTYYWRVRSKNTCGDSSNSSIFSFTTIDSIDYCVAGATNPDFTNISRLVFNTIDNTSPAANTGYADYTGISTPILRGETYLLSTYEAGNSVYFGDQVIVWIDYNKNGIFTDSGEKVIETTPFVSGGSYPFGGNITIPASASLGNTTMRVRINNANNGTSNTTPCGNSTIGEVEDYTVVISTTSITWTGATDNDWDTASNWDTNSSPTPLQDVTIPTGLTNYPTAATAVTVSSTNINSGASLIAQSTFAGSVTYNLAIPDTNWHLVSSPVVGEQYDDAWVTANAIAISGSTGNRGISTYDNTTPHATTQYWRYFTGGSTEPFGPGIGYAGLRIAAPGNLSFTGTFPTTNEVLPGISQNNNNWNLIGNPYPSYMDIAKFIMVNTAKIAPAFQSIYVWNGTVYAPLATGYLHPGQAFFMNSNVATGTATISEDMQSHLTGVFYRNASPTINLMLSDGANIVNTQINYIEGKTIGLDPGFDIGMFDGVSSGLSIYTHLVEDYQGIAFETQALPDGNYESMVVPVGVKAAAGKEITFSLAALNLPISKNVFLEDSATRTFTRLNEANREYTVLLTESLDGIGRFYLHTSSTSLHLEIEDLTAVSIYSASKKVYFSGLPIGKTNVMVCDVLGKKVIEKNITETTKSISAETLAVGNIYLVTLSSEKGKVTKKIIIQ